MHWEFIDEQRRQHADGWAGCRNRFARKLS